MTVAGLVAALLLFALLVQREVRRTSMNEVARVPRPQLGPVTVPLWAELALWIVAAVLLLPRVIGLIT